MMKEDMLYNSVDEIIRGAAEKIPVDFNPAAWEKLTSQLNTTSPTEVAQTASVGKSIMIKSIFLNGILPLVGLVSVLTLTLGIHYSNTSATELVFPTEIIGYQKSNSVSSSPKLFNQVNNSATVNSNPITIHQFGTENHSEEKKEQYVLNENIKVDTVLEMGNKAVTVDSTKNKKFLFW